MYSFRSVLRFALLAALLFGVQPGLAAAQTKITVGMVVGGTGLHIPTYVAMDQGFFKGEGLDATWVTLGGKALVTAGLAGEVGFRADPGGRRVAALHGAPLRYVVGQSLGSQWVIVTPKDHREARGFEGQDAGLWPRRRRRLRRRRRGPVARTSTWSPARTTR